MTQEEKRVCAERLFDEIGLIDDRFISEAATPYAKRRGFRALRGVLIAAASVALAVSMAVGLLVVGMMAIGNNSDDDMANGNTALDGMDNLSDSALTLSSRLNGMRGQTAELKVDKAEVELFGGTPKIIWKYADEEEYRVRTITDAELSELTARLARDKGERVDDTSADSLDGLWIAVGDGTVISPYLEQTAGTRGYGEIFDYVPEYEPSAEFSAYLCEVIS